MQSFAATLYGGKEHGAELPTAGIRVDAFFSGDSLIVEAPALTVDCAKIAIRVGGFEHDEFFLDWRDAADNGYSLKPLTKGDVAFVMANSPPALHRHFAQWHRRRLSIRLVWSTLGALAFAVVLAAGLLWWRYDAVVNWLADRISIGNEEKLGNSVLEQIAADGEIVKEGVAVDALQDIGKRLTTTSRYHYQWLIKKDDTVNAFALPGGIVVVNSALIENVDNANEMAAVLAHEVQHVEQRHALKSMIDNLGWAAGLLVVAGDVNAATVLIVHQLGNSYFSRDKEEEADRLGFMALRIANIKPDGMITVLQKLQKQHGDEMPEWLSSHPDTAHRIEAMQKISAQSPCETCVSLVYDWKKIQNDPALQKH